MAISLSTAVKNAMLDAIETEIGASAKLRIFDGSIPTNTSDPDAGTVLAELDLPADYMAAASGGTKLKQGTWEDSSANATGTAQYFRLYETTLSTCHIQGTVTVTGGGGDMTVANTSFATGQPFEINTFTLSLSNSS